MAVANAKVTVTRVDATLNSEIVYGTIAVDANPATYATHGIPLSFASQDQIKSSAPPSLITVSEAPASGSSASGYEYIGVPGTTQINGVLQIFQCAGSGNPNSELAAAAVPGAVSGAALVFKAEFPRF